MTIGFWLILLAVAAYGFLHSLLASHGAKRLAFRLGGGTACRFYRLFYNMIVAVTLVPVFALVAMLPDRPIYTISFPWSLLALTLQAAAVIGLAAGVMQTGPMRFAGLEQALRPSAAAGDCPPDAPVRPELGTALVTGGLYRYVRHPLYAFGLVLLWLVPKMSWNVLALSLGLTAYLIIGAKLEERKLLREYGTDYEAYMRRTPMLFPHLKR